MENSVHEQFKAIYQSGKIQSLNAVAKAIDISPSALSLWLKGSYAGNNDSIEKKVASYMQLIKERAESYAEETDFVRGISNSEKILDICRLAHVQKTMGLVAGRAGLGKSRALREYAKNNPDVIYIEVDTAYSSRELMREINIIVGHNGKGHLNKLKNEIIDKLKGTGRLLIIDQAEYLGDKALDLLRTIHDKAGIGVILAGLPQLMQNIKGTGGVQEQIYTRIGAAFELSPLKNEDIKKLVANFAGEEAPVKPFIDTCRKNARVLSILTRESKRIAANRNVGINEEIVNQANFQIIK